MLTVYNVNHPRISVTAINSTISEGENAQFRLQSTQQTEISYDVNLISKNEVGNFFSSPGSFTVRMPQRSRETTFSLATQPVSGFNPIGAVAVEVRTGTFYNVASSPNDHASVQVVDADHPAGISIIAAESTIFEGDVAEFQVIVENPINQTTSVSIQMSNPLNYVTPTWFESIIIPANQHSSSLWIPTEDNDVVNSANFITAKLVSAEGYSINQSAQYIASVSVYDNEEVEVSISGGDTIIAGSDVQFELTTNFAPAQDIYVNIDISDGEKDIIFGSREPAVLISAGTQTALVDISTTNRNEVDGTGAITATILPGSNYQVANSPHNTARFNVEIFSGYEISISPYNDGIVGKYGEFLVESNHPLRDNLFVYILVEQNSPDLIRGRIPTLVVIETNKDSAIFLVRIADEIADIPNALITATLRPGEGYSIDTESSSASISIQRYAKPTVSLRKVTAIDVLAESEFADLEFELSNPTVADLEVHFTVICAELGCDNYLLTNLTAQSVDSNSLVITAGQTTARARVEINANTFQDPPSFLKYELRPNDLYFVNSLANEVKFAVNDAVPTETIAIYSNAKSGIRVIEGEDAIFSIFTSTATDEDRTIQFEVTEKGDYIAGNPPTSITIPANDYIVDLVIPTQDDEIFEDNGRIKVVLLPGPNYELEQYLEEDWIPIYDNENSEYTIFKHPDQAQPELIFQEGQDLIVEVKSTRTYSTDKTIDLLISETGNMLAPAMTGPHSITLPSGSKSAELTIETIDDAVAETASSITISFIPTDYLRIISNHSSVTFDVEDNESQLQVRSVSTSITEGEFAEFEVSLVNGAFSRVNQYIPINFEVSQVGNFVENLGLNTDTMFSGSSSKTIRIPTIDDRAKESSGSVTLTLVPTDEYSVVQNSNFATVAINDDEPEISIAVAEDSNVINKGRLANFEITSAEARQTDTTIMMRIVDPGNNVVGDLNREVLMAAGETQVDFTVQTQRNENTEGDSNITVEVLANQHYSLNSDAKQVSVRVLDLDRPRIALTTETPTITEGENIEIELTASSITPILLPINLLVEESSSDFIDLGAIIIENMQAFTDSTSFVIATIDDSVDEHDGSISITVLDGNGYNPSQVATENTISVNIQDNDLPEVFLTSDQSRITEGGTVQFLIHSADNCS